MPDDPEKLREELKKIEASLSSLMERRDSLRTGLEGSGAIAQGERARAVGKRGVMARDIRGMAISGDGNIVIATEAFLRQFFPERKSEKDLRQATETYLVHLIDAYRYLDFKGMGVSDRIPLRLPLTDMYVPLKARIELPEGETWSRNPRLAGRHIFEDEAGDESRGLSEPASILELLRSRDGLIVLGDPGSGKTTFLKYLCLKLSQGQGNELGLSARLPVLVPLSTYANALADKDIPLDRFLARHYRDQGIELPMEKMLEMTLAQGGALLLLDGLDEVRDLRDRHIVVKRVVAFFNRHRRCGNKFVLTSRVVGYREVRPAAKGLVECTLVDFEDEEITSFVEKWTVALEKAARGDSLSAAHEASREKAELLEAVDRNSGIRRLASNPLMLTILALMKRQGVTLPDRRVELYEKYVEVLLNNWNLARGLDRPPHRQLDVIETLKILAPLALWMHKTNPGKGLVKRETLSRKLETICRERGAADPESAARQMLSDVREHAGLLLERGPGEYGFIHLTFQEYLAAVAVVQQGQSVAGPVIRILADHVGDDNWHEVALLSVAHMGLIQQRDETASEVVLGLCESGKGNPGEAIVMAGEAASDAWPGGITLKAKEEIVSVLLKTLTDENHVAPEVRAAAGKVLPRLGDPRFSADAWFLPDDGMFGFMEIPEGPFVMGTEEKNILQLIKRFGGSEKWYQRETPRHEPIVGMFYMSVYPVTVAQFKSFVEQSGYKPEDKDCLKGLLNHPVVHVTWRDTIAYCEWLTGELRGREGIPGPIKKSLSQDGWVVRLPTEAEWEKAASGDKDARIFPWGDDPDPDKANYNETGIGATSAVGCFAKGESPYGMLDMSGNVWEWCATKWEDSYQNYGNDNDLEGNDPRVVRGGAFDVGRRSVRAASRLRFYPDLRLYLVGFRVVVAPRPTSDL